MIDDYDGADVFDAEGNKIGTVERTYVDDSGAGRLIEVKLGTLLAKHRLVPLDDADVGSRGVQVPYSKDVIESSPDARSVDETLEGDLIGRVRGYYGGGSSPNTVESGNVDQVDEETADDVAARPVGEVDDGDEEDRGVVQRVKDNLTGGEEGRAALTGEREEAPTAVTGEDAVPTDDTSDMGGIRDRGDYLEIPVVEEELVKRPVVKEVLRVRKQDVTDTEMVGADVRREDIETTPTGRVEPVEEEE